MGIIDNTQFGKVGYFKYWCQKVLPAVYDDSLSYYELLCKVMKWLEDLTTVTNEQSDAIAELQDILEQFMEGTFDPIIEAKIDEWFIENEPALMALIEAIKENSDKVPDIETRLDYLETHISDNYSYNGFDVFVNALSGDDDNDGLSDATALKTLEKALSFIDRGYTAINIRIRSNGVYYVERQILYNVTVHITPASTTSDVSIYWALDHNDSMNFYNCYIHMSTQTPNTFKNYFPNGIHFDHCGMYAQNVNLYPDNRFDISYSTVEFRTCRLATDNYLRIFQSNVYFHETNFFDINSDLTPIFAYNSHVVFHGTMNIISSGSSITDKIMFRFDDCFIDYNAITNYTNTNLQKYNYGIYFHRCFGIITVSIAPYLEDCATTAFSGDYSVIQNLNTATVFS